VILRTDRFQSRERSSCGRLRMSFLCGLLSFVAAATAAFAGGAETEASCEVNLTCAKATEAALAPEISSGPDLSRWRRLTSNEASDSGGAPAPATRNPAPPSVRDSVTGMTLVLIPGACYRTDGSIGQSRKVCLRPYYIGTHEVTFDEFDRYTRATGRDPLKDEGWGRGRRPAINVSVYDALGFAKWLSRKTGAHYRLPTEVEWAHAARAGSSGRYPWGDELVVGRANCAECGSRWDNEQTAPVGSFKPNAWGLYDVVGNVGEWTCSMRDPDPTHSFERCDSVYKTRRRAYRNGGWSDDAARLALSFRDWNVAMRRTDDVGFRLVRECRECDAGKADGVTWQALKGWGHR